MSKKTTNKTTIPDLEVLSVRELAAYLGTSVWFIRRLVTIRKIPYTKIGGRVLFYMPAMREWLRDNTTWPGKHTSDWHRKRYDPSGELIKLMNRGDDNFA
ncbi:MAG TPA: helix-turn-helix domain-containing protein [Bacteroidota bacterium]|jgi:excisionase family DNA binding protein